MLGSPKYLPVAVLNLLIKLYNADGIKKGMSIMQKNMAGSI